ncbi:MAG: CvpA family protein [Proteobacteria bacterium]|nr:CvpA family protein [Pseudomonadota bacterium]
MQTLSTHATDLAVIAVLVVSGLWAFLRGFVHEVLAIGAWLGAVFAALYGFPLVQPYARSLIGLKIAADLAAGAGLFLVTLVVLSLVTKAIAGRIRRSALNPLDRSLGFLYGLLRGAVVVSLAYLALTWFLPPERHPGWVAGARSRVIVAQGAEFLAGLVPKELGLRADGAAGGRTSAEMPSERVFRMLIRPEPKAPAPARGDGYDARQRREIEQLLRANQ